MLSTLDFGKKKQNKEMIAMVTAYDYPSAKIAERAGCEVILTGDSLGMVVLGYETTLQVTMEDMLCHVKAVTRGAKNTFVIADLPFMSYHLSPVQAKKNAAKLMRSGLSQAVKLEGGTKERLEVITAIVSCEIPVVAHLGLTPQSYHVFGGYKVQGKDDASSAEIFRQAQRIEEAGAFMVVLEGIPEQLGKEISEKLTIPTIGIGAGRYTDGQVLVWHDLLGISGMETKFSQKYAETGLAMEEALKHYLEDVRSHKFPQRKNAYYPID